MRSFYEKLLQGYREFKSNNQDLMQNLAHGQKPETMIVACCDARVDPALLLNTQPGELFVHRNVASIIPPYERDEFHHGTSAALEFAVCYLKVKYLIIMGHSQCGGIQAMLDQDSLVQDDFIGNWVGLIKGVYSKTKTSEQAVKEALLISYKNLLSFPWIAAAMEEGNLKVHLWYTDIETCTIYDYDFDAAHFEAVGPVVNRS